MKACKAKNAKGEPCQAPAIDGSEYCFFHAPERAADRQAARVKGAKASPRKTVVLGNDVDLADAESVRALLAGMLREVMGTQTGGRMDIVKKARCAGYLGGILLKAVELSEIEKRITALEEGRDAETNKE